jgi:cell fate (sporulation/competence/biofilm development) regulator YlbF (YheA/YmcA/DUF963 family)
MNKQEIINSIQKGDNVLIKYDEEYNKMSVVLDVLEDKIIFKDIDGRFEFTKKYLINGDLELEIIEEC